MSATVTLRDGTDVLVRPMTPEDAELLRAFHEGLSAKTVYLRFFSAHPHLSDADLEYFTQVDQADRVALVADLDGELVAVGRFDVLADASRATPAAEVAFVVTDRMQGLGLGGQLLVLLAGIARELGIERFVAEVLPSNSRMLATFRHSGFDVTETSVEDVIEVSFPLGRA